MIRSQGSCLNEYGDTVPLLNFLILLSSIFLDLQEFHVNTTNSFGLHRFKPHPRSNRGGFVVGEKVFKTR